MSARPKPPHWEHPEEYDHALVIACADARRAEALRDHLAKVPGRNRVHLLGSYPRFRVAVAEGATELSARVTPTVTAAAIDLTMPRVSALELIQELRRRRPDLALLAFTGGGPASQAIAAVMAGADFVHESLPEGDHQTFERALDLALDRRRLTRLVEQSEAAAADARTRLAQLSGELARSLPGFRPPQVPDDVLPFQEAARRYLLASARLFEGDAKGLAARLGVSYFALRRLFARYDIPLPTQRPRGRKR
ncbi:MAG TPA: response regulator [Anaeromyxobacteraceae bacterium]|nr:response regulator [Anaeromyxobacteraceae bacterium]